MDGRVRATGYEVRDRKLIINEAEAATVRMIFERFVTVGSATTLARALIAEGVRTRRGRLVDKGFLYKLLNNRVYVGEAVHKGTAYPGAHAGIVDPDAFVRVQTILAANGRVRAAATRAATPALIKGLIFTAAGRAMTPHHTKKGSRLYRYYVSTDVIRGRAPAGPAEAPWRLAAGMVETAVIRELRRLIRAPEIVAQALVHFRREDPGSDERAALDALRRFDELWPTLFPAEQARLVRLLVDRVTVTAEGLAVDLRADGIGAIVHDMLAPEPKEAA